MRRQVAPAKRVMISSAELHRLGFVLFHGRTGRKVWRRRRRVRRRLRA